MTDGRSCSPARLAANRANARRSTGPRSLAGKAVSARNAQRHGLAAARVPDLAQQAAVEALACALAAGCDDKDRLALARRLAWATLELRRVQAARRELLSTLEPVGAEAVAAATADVVALERYERRALSRRRSALRAFDAAARPGARDSEEVCPIRRARTEDDPTTLTSVEHPHDHPI